MPDPLQNAIDVLQTFIGRFDAKGLKCLPSKQWCLRVLENADMAKTKQGRKTSNTPAQKTAPEQPAQQPAQEPAQQPEQPEQPVVTEVVSTASKLTKRNATALAQKLVLGDKRDKTRAPQNVQAFEAVRAVLPATVAEVLKALEDAKVPKVTPSVWVSYMLRRGYLAPAKPDTDTDA